MYTKTLLPAFAAFGAVLAQSTNTLCSSDALIKVQADADKYASCTKIDGDVVIDSSAMPTIALNGPRSVSGDFTVLNATQLITISSTSIESIGGSFHLDGVRQLSTLRFDKLTSVGDINWSTLGNLGSLTFPSIISSAKKVIITDTFLRDLDGINLKTVDTMDINNNQRLTKFSTQVTSVSTLLNIAVNNADLDVSLPNLVWATDVTFRNVTNVSIPSLATVNGSIGFYACYMDSIMAPNLTTVGSFGASKGSLSLVANQNLANISFPLLNSVGGAVLIANNTILSDIAFPALTQVAGAIDFSGVFNTPSLPKLTNVKGASNMQSKSTIDCAGFTKLKNVFQGVLTCKSAVGSAQSADGIGASGSGTSTTGGASASATPKSGAAAFGASEAIVGMSALGALFSLLL